MRMARNTGTNRVIDIVHPRFPAGYWFDCGITAIASFRGTAIAARRVLDLENRGVDVVEPWPERQ